MLQRISLSVDALRPHFTACPIHIGWRAGQHMEGEHVSNAAGRGTDFLDFREYSFGDDLRRLNWKAFAKSDRPVVTLFEEERRITVAVLVDVSPSMRFGTQELLKNELAAVLAASVLRSVAEGDQAFFAAYSQSEMSRCLKDKPAREVLPQALPMMMEKPEMVVQAANGGLSAALRRLSDDRSLVFIVSDFQSMSDEDKRALQRASRKHEVICLVVSDLRERELPDTRLCRWLPLPLFCQTCDSEGGTQIVLPTAAYRASYQAAFEERYAALANFLKASGAKYAAFDTEEESDRRKLRLQRMLRSNRTTVCLDHSTQGSN